MKKLILFLFLALTSSFIYGQYVDESFEGSWPPTGWLVVNNGSGNDWTQNTSSTYSNTGSNSAKYGYNSSNAADAWLFTKGVTLANGETVNWEFYERVASGTFPENLKFTVGTAQTVASQTTTLIDLPGLTNTSFVKQSGTYTAPAAGTYFFALNCYSDADQWNLFVDDVLIETPPACPDPSAQTESNMTATTVDLSWQENGTASSWDIELGTTGFSPTGTPTQSGVTNPYTYGGLTSGSTYDWYVRADCGGGSYSNWVGPHTFTLVPPPANDDCDGAYVVTVNSDLNCGNTTSGTVEGATQSPEDAAACGGTEDDDVWFKFVATGTTHKIELLNVAGSTTDLYHSVWEGTCPGGLTLVSGTCSDPNSQTVSGLTVGNTYFIRVYTWTSTGGQNTTFDVCVGTPPPPPANDDCDGAYVVTVNSDLNCGSTTSGTVENATQSPEDASACSGTEDDDVWFKFVATATEHKIELLNAAGSTTDLYHSVWEGTCPGGLTLVPGTCSDPNSQTVSGLTIGNTYYIRVYTWTSTGGQNTTFDVCVGTPPPPPANDNCSGAISLTVGNPGDCPTNQVTTDATYATADGNTSCDTYGDNIGVWYSFVAPATGEVVVNYTAGTATGNPGIVVYDACGGSEVPGTCQDNPATLSNITGLTGGTTYYMLLWFDGASNAGSFDICLEDVGSCPKPSGQTESNITATSADLDWTENGTATTWDIEWGATGFTQGSGTTVTGITSKPYTLSGLTASTDYDWYVRADCGGGSQSPWEGPHTFTTAPPPPANDECSSATILNCGDNLTGETTDGASDNGDDTGCGMGKGVWYKYVASDIYELTVTATPEAGYDIELSVSTSSDCSTFTNLACRDSGGSGSAETYTFTTTAGTTYYFYVAHYNNTSTTTGDFDISLSCVTCIDPSGQTETNITATSADLDWTENGGASTWEIEWGTQGFTQGSGTTVTGISSKPYTLSGLTAQTDYDWYVRSDCGGGDFSNWTGPHSFTTLSADEVDWCNLQWPDQATITVGSSVDVYAQVYEPGVTDASGQGAGISAWIGYSTTDTDPATWTNWVVATYNVDDGNNDEYQAALGAGLTPGTYYYASRFQLNGGVYKYGGYSDDGGSPPVSEGGFWDGTNYVSGILTIDPVVANDDCSGAYTLTVGNGACFDPVTSTNVDATDSHTYDNSIPAPGCANYSGGDLWFKVTVPASGNITIESSRTDGFTDAGMAAYSGDCSNLTLIECNDDGNSNPGTNYHSRLDLTGQTAGSTIYIRVWEYGNDNYGNFAVCAWEPMDAVVSLIGDGTCEANLPVSVSHSEGNTYTWVPLVDASDNVIAYIYPYGNVLGDVIATVYRNTSGTIREDDDNIPYLDRDVEITVGGQPTGDNPRLKILYLKSEIDALIAADPAVTTIDDINFTKFETSCSGSYSGQGQPVAQTGNGTVNAANDNYIQCTVSSFSTFYGNRAGYSLPVQLATFSGYAGKDANILQWTTFSEINTAAYYVERSISGKEWSLVDKVEAAGDSYTEKDYSAVDNNPVSKAFYRLHIMDKDGRYSVSKVISIERKDSGLKLNAVYPNPNDGNFVVNLTSEPNAEGKMILVNALGVKVYTKELNVQGGRTIEKIDVSNLPTGVYTLLLEQNNNIITERVIINR